mmetsp:Transcript_29479/g.71839  ORF Transcript_29479/g.71839 Transcript_29479/m.71839 type:complete len:280 (+) Transcript_29479:217-1056(+)|eukprot:CAMPEP_0114489786 /NCGR_PEP_ID=MMETSP0109-20121206/2080_1 /TAXON_ID=29199 /ORGANISM="Chlorarachnion reptans, Strain CCCM449" /LENGTH=279 /DNA_ID=CAMNT_0001666331 /DNA_START=150 /DNA_END=989 /DNA_ORIENTATION=-
MAGKEEEIKVDVVEIKKNKKAWPTSWHFTIVAAGGLVVSAVAFATGRKKLLGISGLVTAGAAVGVVMRRPVYGANGKVKRVGTYSQAVTVMGKVTLIPTKRTKGTLYRSCMPGGSYDDENEVLGIWRGLGITHLLCLNPVEEIKRKSGTDLLLHYKRLNYEVLECPIRNYEGTQLRRIGHAVKIIGRWLSNGHNVVVHCSAGVGRTGMVVGCFLQSELGFSSEEAIAFVRKHIRCSLTNPKQITVVSAYGGKRDGSSFPDEKEDESKRDLRVISESVLR